MALCAARHNPVNPDARYRAARHLGEAREGCSIRRLFIPNNEIRHSMFRKRRKPGLRAVLGRHRRSTAERDDRRWQAFGAIPCSMPPCSRGDIGPERLSLWFKSRFTKTLVASRYAGVAVNETATSAASCHNMVSRRRLK